ncbi:MAG: serine hydrolase [Ekhidna sp.]
MIFRKIASVFFILLLTLNLGCKTSRDAISNYEYKPPEKQADGWNVSTLSDQNIDVAPILELVNSILNDRYTDIHSLLISRNGDLVFEEYFNGFDSDDFHVLFSATKSYSSTLIGLAIEAGHIASVDEPIAHFFTDKAALFTEEKREITLADLLTMTAGFQWDEWTTSGLSLANSHEQMMQSVSQVDYVLGLPLVSKPGTNFTYNTGLSNLMAPIIETATGESIAHYMQQELFSKLDITNYRWQTVIDDYPSTGGSRGGLEMKPRDMIKLGQLFLDGGTWKGEQVISSTWVSEALKPRISESEHINYGYQWWNRTYFSKNGVSVIEYDAVGDGGQWIFIFPEYELIVGFTGGNYTWVKEKSLMFQPVNMVQHFILPAIN